MAFQDFASVQYIRTIDSSEELQAGSFQVVDNLELKYMRLTIHIEGALSITNEKVGVKIYSDSTYQNVLATSSLASLSEIAATTNHYLGWLRIDFNRENLNNKLTYYPKIYTQNYTLVANTFEIGFCYDFPYPIYDNAEDLFYNHPLQFSIFGYKA